MSSKEETIQLQNYLDILKNSIDKTITMKVNIFDTDKIMAISYIPEFNWYSVSMVDYNSIDLTDLFGKYLLFSLSGFSLFVFALMYFLNKNVLKPIMKLNESVQQIKDGKYNIDLLIDNKNEIGNLALHIKQMASKVENYTHDLENSILLSSL